MLDVERLEILQAEGAFAVNAHQVLAESIERLQPQLGNRGIEPKITLKARNPWVGLAEDKLLQIFLNLLSNGIKFSDADQPKLEVLSYDGGVGGEGWYLNLSTTAKVIPADFRQIILISLPR